MHIGIAYVLELVCFFDFSGFLDIFGANMGANMGPKTIGTARKSRLKILHLKKGS